ERQRAGERLHPIEFGLIAKRMPRGVVAILFSMLAITPGGLDVSARVGTDPDVGPCGRHRERANAIEHRPIANHLAVAPNVHKPCGALAAHDSALPIAPITQSGDV